MKPTTTYVIDLQKLENNYNEFKKFGEIYFPVKTNSNQSILNKLKRLGSGFECDAIDHIKKIYSKNIADKIIFSNVAKTLEDINWAIKHKLTFYTVDDEQTLNTIITLAKQNKFTKLKINVRINVYDIFREDFVAKNTVDSRLGASVKTCKKLLNIINNETEIEIEKGISFYVQAEFHDKEDILEVTSNYLAKNFSKKEKLNWINIGGGSSITRLTNSATIMYSNLKTLNVEKIILEPGRFMVDGVEDLFIPIRRVIKSDLNGGETIVSLSVGIYHGLLDYKLHNRKFNFFVIDEEGNEIKLEPYSNTGKKIVLRGPTADSSDVLGVYVLPNIEINANSLFVIKNVGAYVEVLHSTFSGIVPLKFIALK